MQDSVFLETKENHRLCCLLSPERPTDTFEMYSGINKNILDQIDFFVQCHKLQSVCCMSLVFSSLQETQTDYKTLCHWTQGRKKPPTLLHTSQNPRLKETQTVVILHVFVIILRLSGCLVSLCGCLMSLCSCFLALLWFCVALCFFCCFVSVVFCLFIVDLHLCNSFLSTCAHFVSLSGCFASLYGQSVFVCCHFVT